MTLKHLMAILHHDKKGHACFFLPPPNPFGILPG
jgi:hypothetical protein